MRWERNLRRQHRFVLSTKKKKNTEPDGGKADYLNERTDSALLSWGGFFSEV